MIIKNNDVILFNGDSITDVRRRALEPPYQLTAYSKMVFDQLSTKYSVTGYNRGVSCDTSMMLLSRLKGELEEIKPTVFSMLIGVNNVWNKSISLSHSVEMFKQSYQDILKLVSQYTNRIILLEPFLFAGFNLEEFRVQLDIERQFIKEMADKYNADFVPLDSIFSQLTAKGNQVYSDDGVHLTQAGNEVVANEWLRTVK